ncbi:hypothetical protein PT158_08710 [Erysipelothrix rhusiopathiae]|nr:hypothetical protein [Erysipelothrix rhusiopathiae]
MKCYTTTHTLLNDGTLRLKQFNEIILIGKKNTGGDSTKEGEKVNRRNRDNKQTRKQNLNKSKNTMCDLILNNYEVWKSFATYTFAEDISREDAMTSWHNYVRQVRRVFPEVIMIKVDEFTKNGRPHFHVLSNIECGSELYPLLETPLSLWNKEKKAYTTVEYANLKYWNHGHTHALKLSATDENFNIALYMTKYMMKDFDTRHYNKQKYTVINKKRLAEPRTHKLNEYEVQKTMQVIEYLTKKNYNIETFTYQPNRSFEEQRFAIGFTEHDTKIKQEDMEELRKILSE